MAFTGQLNDLALSELIEFFCNQRKTGRLKVDYALAPGVFFIKDGDLVDAKVGALNGTDAVFFALTLPSASFDFSAGMQSSRRTITDSWASVVLEGLRRIDEGILPDASKAFASEEEIDDATIEYLNCIEVSKEEAARDEAKNVSAQASNDSAPLPLSQTLEAAHSSGGGRSKLIVAGVAASLVLACVVAAIPLSKRLTRSTAAAPAASAPAPTQTATDASTVQSGDGASATPAASTDPNANAATPEAAEEEEAARLARRERDARLERQRKLQEAKRADAAQASTDATAPEAAAPKPAPAGPKSVRVSISYDEAGRVTQTSVVGASPGAEAYASTAVRVARGRRFPAGKAGSTVITIPIN
jgi:chemotaxis protein histidine kinase CheA